MQTIDKDSIELDEQTISSNTLTDSENESDFILGVKTEGYRRMNLKEQSESDKDLIIYSLNESLSIHKEIVERVQQEKDDLEYYYEQTMREQQQKLKQEQAQADQAQTAAQMNLIRLEETYRSLMVELETKQLEHERMTSRFDAHQTHPIHPSLAVTQSQIESMLSHVESVAQQLCPTTRMIETDLIKVDPAHYVYWIEKCILDCLFAHVFNVPIHPGVSLNRPFQTIYRWMAKRNTAWASRMRQQITLFVVKQSKEETNRIRSAEQTVLDRLWDVVHAFDGLTERREEIRLGLETVVQLAIDLNKVIKCQEDETIKILETIEPNTPFDPAHMVNLRTGQANTVEWMVSPAFVAHTSSLSFIIPARVICYL
ncbi:hypothetical protein BD560DRAFT_394513 [Blakeslea trispora]|nr:hypothetical protein BD560DRAFT_394513 [Blakeslea trispora]